MRRAGFELWVQNCVCTKQKRCAVSCRNGRLREKARFSNDLDMAGKSHRAAAPPRIVWEIHGVICRDHVGLPLKRLPDIGMDLDTRCEIAVRRRFCKG